MNMYRSFELVAAIFACAAGAAGVAALVLWARLGSWDVRPVQICTAAVFFLMPAAALFRLLSSPLHEQDRFLIYSSVALILIWLLAAPVQVLRRNATKRGKA